MNLDHPLIQSVVLPLLVAFGTAGLLHRLIGARHGPRWAAAALGLAVLACSLLLLGWRLALPATAVEKLPWVFAAAWLTGLLLDATRPARWLQWAFASLLWLALSWWLGSKDVISGAASALIGTAVLAALHDSASERASAASMSLIASLGLAAVAMMSGSLLLFQLSVLLAAALGGVALWLWPKARIAFGPAAWVTAGIGWLALAHMAALLTPAPPTALAALAAVFIAGPIVRRLPLMGRRVVVEPLVVAVAAALLAGVALAWTASIEAHDTPDAGDNPYYTSQVEPR
ncbi:MAG: hypothetical protein H0W40_13770 [Methylibium sp.]|uniref:hypothetical protein n=1 Tax=Methylibium sp. TaxID=2067992 RepID=UPI00181B5295|nr:hypothetical protein [Methylibium sp.]MBA3598424.1 hypothetical protein [Methylibium sp.]